MERYRDYPIAKRLTGMNMLVSGIALLLACAAFFAYDIISYRQAIARNLSIQAQIIASNTASALIFNDPHAAEMTLSAFRVSPRIVTAEIYTTDRRPFAGYWRDKGGPPKALPKLPPGSDEMYWFSGGNISLVRAITFQGKFIGTVFITADLGTLYARLRSYAIIALGVLLMSMLAAWLVSSISQRVISQPLMTLADTARTVSRDKNYSLRAASPDTRNEIATLVEAFNDMLAEIQRRDSALQEAHDELEIRVQKRTAELRQAEDKLRALSARLLQLRDEERREIARELHDSSGQNLAALNINLSILQQEANKWGPKASKAVSDSMELAQNVLQEVRTISYLLHPPLLDDAGLESAIRWFIDGFVERSGIPVSFEVSIGTERLPAEMETAIFRVVQECLTNIHRHSESPNAKIHLSAEADQIMLEVRDSGKGMPKESDLSIGGRAGVGISGMQERIRRLGGRLEIQSDGRGTIVTAIVPLHMG
jgi:signal transduction histidine kinase